SSAIERLFEVDWQKSAEQARRSSTDHGQLTTDNRMRGQTFLDRLKQRFSDKITGSNLEAIDPWIEVSPDGLIEICTYLREEPDLQFNMLELISGVDYFEPDAKKAAKVTWQPHMELVYHLWSVPNRVSLVLKVMLPRWKDDREGELPEV